MGSLGVGWVGLGIRGWRRVGLRGWRWVGLGIRGWRRVGLGVAWVGFGIRGVAHASFRYMSGGRSCISIHPHPLDLVFCSEAHLLHCGPCLLIHRCKYNPHREAVPRLKCMWVCVCVCAPAQRAPKWTGKLHFELWARPNDQIHTKYVKMADLESIHLNTVYVWTRTTGRKSDVCHCVKMTDWRFINFNQTTKCKEKITHSS